MKLLALDFASTTGFAFYIDGKLSSGYVKFTARSKEPRDIRLLKFRQWLEANAKGCSIISYEAVRNLKSAQAVICLAELQSVLKLFALENDIELIPYSVSEIKKHCTGRGNAKKPEMIAAVNSRYDLSVTSNDEADAIAIMGLMLEKIKSLDSKEDLAA